MVTKIIKLTGLKIKTMKNSDLLIRRLELVSNHFPSYFLPTKKNQFRHKRTQTNQFKVRIQKQVTQDCSSFTSRTLRSSSSPKVNPHLDLLKDYSPSTKHPKFCLPLEPSTTRLQLSRPSSNQVSKLLIPLRLKPRSPNIKYLKIKIPKVA